MLNTVINSPDLNKYVAKYRAGEIIFLEGDNSQDLYILVSGQVDVFKGNKNIAEIADKGSLFGEMSFLLGAKRTATVKARNAVRAIRIPKEEITDFLHESPDVARQITQLLAQRLDETSQILYGLKEFCDQLPDAVIMTDKEGKILTWNAASEKLYGREWDRMRYKPVMEIYEDPEAYKIFIEEVQSGGPIREKMLTVRHPQKGTRFISTSMTLLYDDHDDFQGVLSLGRDVTAVKNLEKRYRRTRNWLIPSLCLLGLVIFLAVAIIVGYPYFSNIFHAMGVKEQELRNQMARDYLLLKSLLVGHFGDGDRSKTTQLMKDFFYVRKANAMPYTGLVLLDPEKQVFNAYSIKDKAIADLVGSTYTGIEFQGTEKSPHKVLSLYRTDRDHPMGYKGIEIAFEIRRDKKLLGWVVFQMDVEKLWQSYGVDEKDLKRFQFKEP